jgi:hypothetical protein
MAGAMSWRWHLWLLCLAGLACRGQRAAPAAAAPSPPSERDELLARIVALDEVAPCLIDAGAPPIRLVDAELAGEAATATFACTNGAARGRVTFFRIAGRWMVSTKAIRLARD